MSACESICNCGAPGGYIHDPDCRWWEKCDHDGEGAMCDKHEAEAKRDHAYLRGTPSAESERQDLIDSGRGHLIDTRWLDAADAELDRLKEAGAI